MPNSRSAATKCILFSQKSLPSVKGVDNRSHRWLYGRYDTIKVPKQIQ